MYEGNLVGSGFMPEQAETGQEKYQYETIKISRVSVSTPGHPGDVSRTTNFRLDRLAGDQGLHLCRPPCKPRRRRYIGGVTWGTAVQAGHKKGLRG